MPRQGQCGRFAHLANAKPVQESRQCRLLALLDGRQQIRRGLLAHALELGELRHAERVEIGRGAHFVPFDELLDELVAEALDIERTAAGEVAQRLLELRPAGETAGAARDRLALETQHLRLAYRTPLG